ncbi:MAG: TraR/DksA family transcriptional regulator [Verrucomicrobia bacterium]|nr:TraR/DksA family transcriptional regulator [Verrucomicrobiota bacterium]
MATKKTAKKAPAKKAAAKKAPAKKAPVKKAATKKAASVAISSGGVPLTGKIARNKHFPVKVLREQLNRLLLLRERVSGEISSISRDSLSPTERDPSMSDQGTDTFDREFALNQLSSEQDVLFEIDEAIRRLENGTYGICEISNDPINIERLQALPYVRYTIATQSEIEKGRTTYRPFGSTFRS